MNQVILAGKVQEIEIINNSYVVVVLQVVRPFKNQDGEYETDIFKIDFYFGVGYIEECIHINSSVLIRARLDNSGVALKLIGEKISLFQQNKRKRS